MAPKALFEQDGVEYMEGDCVYCRAEEGPPYIGEVSCAPPPCDMRILRNSHTGLKNKSRAPPRTDSRVKSIQGY
jgi:hypothetical protein